MKAKFREVPVRFHSTSGTLTVKARAATPTPESDGETSIENASESSATQQVGGIAYTGGVLQSMFGDVIVDMQGMQPLPERGAALLYGHSQPIGVVRSVDVTDRGIEYSGEMVRGLERSAEIAALAANGFPWQLSIRAEPDVVEDVSPGVMAEVNGISVEGPIMIFRQWRLPEISIVELGLDSRTEATVAAHAGGGVRRRVLVASPAGETMTDTETAAAPATVEDLRASSPELVAEIEAAANEQGVNAERSRVVEIINATVQAIAGEGEPEGDTENVEAQALAVVASAVQGGQKAQTLLASLIKLSRAAVKATAVPASAQEARRAVTASATAVETGTDEAETTGSATAASGPIGSLMASASADWKSMSASQRAATKCIDEDAYVGERLLAAKGK